MARKPTIYDGLQIKFMEHAVVALALGKQGALPILQRSTFNNAAHGSIRSIRGQNNTNATLLEIGIANGPARTILIQGIAPQAFSEQMSNAGFSIPTIKTPR